MPSIRLRKAQIPSIQQFAFLLCAVLTLGGSGMAQPPPAPVRAQQPPPQQQVAVDHERAQIALQRRSQSVCQQWVRIQDARSRNPQAAQSVPAFAALKEVCPAKLQGRPVQVDGTRKQAMADATCADWNRLAALRQRSPEWRSLPAMQELAESCSAPPQILKNAKCSVKRGSILQPPGWVIEWSSGCCCEGAWSCGWEAMFGTCTTECSRKEGLCTGWNGTWNAAIGRVGNNDASK